MNTKRLKVIREFRDLMHYEVVYHPGDVVTFCDRRADRAIALSLAYDMDAPAPVVPGQGADAALAAQVAANTSRLDALEQRAPDPGDTYLTRTEAESDYVRKAKVQDAVMLATEDDIRSICEE